MSASSLPPVVCSACGQQFPADASTRAALVEHGCAVCGAAIDRTVLADE